MNKVARPRKEESIDVNNVAEDFDEDTYFKTIYRDVKNDDGGIDSVEKKVLKPDFGSHLIKCQIRCAKRFNVMLNHLKKVVFELNGKKLDGFIVNDLIGRYGYYNGEQLNRDQVATKYKTNSMQVEIAEQKLAEIIKQSDPKQAYIDYTQIKLNETQKEIVDSAGFGG